MRVLMLNYEYPPLGRVMGMDRLFFGVNPSDMPLFLLAVFMVIIGVRSIVSGILADIILKVYYGQSDGRNYLIQRITEYRGSCS